VNADALRTCDAHGLLGRLFDELKRGRHDVLLQLNTLQCLLDLAAGKAHCTRVGVDTSTCKLTFVVCARGGCYENAVRVVAGGCHRH
jgi:hypothetical protein